MRRIRFSVELFPRKRNSKYAVPEKRKRAGDIRKSLYLFGIFLNWWHSWLTSVPGEVESDPGGFCKSLQFSGKER
jgi:hypothetical protein